MSGKPASVGASRAGVPGTPRVLVYVADPRQLEPGAAARPPPAAPPPSHLDALYLPDNLHQQVSLPRSTIYRTQVDRNDQKSTPGTIFYKQLNDNDNKRGVFGASDNTIRTEFMPISQQLVKDSCLKNDESIVNHLDNVNVKRDIGDGAEIGSIETFQARIPGELGEIPTYQTRGSIHPGSDSVMPPMHPITLRHAQNQYSESVNVQTSGDASNSSERELTVGRSYVNYQFLEQSVSHQSIVNQSISILNQQVGVNRGIVSEGESGNAPQLVRTADGVVLAVLPSGLPQPADTLDLIPKTVQSDAPQTIIVPLGWRRIVSSTSVIYISPSGTALSTLPQLRDYLQTTGTCKCGLPCPLRPETAFSFDPKVVSKPYQAASGAELTKLCNHKRKLLATLQARHSPATPPPQIDQKKVTGAEVAVLKKKMKKRPGFPPNMSVSQLVVQRERPFNEFKSQENEHNRTISPGIGPHRINHGQPVPTFTPMQQNILNAIPQDSDVKQETQVQRSSHYLTVSSGWITQQQENLDGQKTNQTSTGSGNTSINVGLPVLGTNGQIIGVNTGFNKQTTNFKNVVGVIPHNVDLENKDEKKDAPTQSNVNPIKFPVKEEESQIFCGLNQPLTPEVMQKINEQQQIFIQQNQKQIEMAMKGFRTQLADNVNQNKSQNQYVPQAQLVIQNGTVVKTNPAKTPPWQVKRNDSSSSNSMTSPNLKGLKMDNIDYEESNANISEDSITSYNSFPNNEHMMNQTMCTRVPPLPQHYNMLGQQWPNVDTNKKKAKNNGKGAKKKTSPVENKLMTYGANGMRLIQEPKCDDIPNNNVPSFMDDPNGYLAQQTVLLNNTISRQVGINNSFDSNQYENCNNCYTPHSQNYGEKTSKATTKSCETVYRTNMVPNPSPSPNNTPDSSVLSDKTIENSISQCYKSCNLPMKGSSPDFSENNLRLKYMKHNVYKTEFEGHPPTTSPKHCFDDNPVTSSTFIERSPIMNDNCGPIQAGTVSTSNVSPTETLQPPEPSPTLSNSSRSTDTPHSNGSSGSQMQQNCTFPIPSPAYSGSCRDSFNSNPPTPNSGQMYHYNSPGPPNNQSITGTQMMHFISNHNVNKNLMEVDNISMVGVKPNLKPPHEMFRPDRRRIENSMPGYCPPPHLGGGPAHSLIQACYVQTFVTTMASGFSVTRDTVTSVLAGKANTATTSINASQANFIRPPPPPSVNLATTYAIPNNQPDPFINSVNLPTSYPLHIAGTTAQNMISKSPLEMVQNVIGSLPSKSEITNAPSNTLSQTIRRTCPTTPGQILISSTGQIIVSNNQMPPPPPKTSTTMSPIQNSNNIVTNVTTSITQVVPAVGGVQPIVNQPTVVVNTLPTPFVFQPPMVAVDGQVVQQNQVLPQIVTGGIVSGQSPNENSRSIDLKNTQNYMQGVAMLSPESLKKRNKKKKNQPPNITNVLQITAPQQNPNNLMVHHTSPQHNSSPQFSPRSFQLSPNNNISPTPVLQALTIVPGKSGTPAHIVMNGQGNSNNFGSQQIITNTSPSQQINLLQPVNLINNASNVMQNFPAFQQFIVPNLGGMVMTADGAIIQDNSTGMPMQLQLQTVNGQNVLTPVQNPGMFAAGANGGVVIRAQNQQGKIIQSQHSPGAQFLSPNNQVMMNSPSFNGQLSPLLANLSPTNVAFNNSQVRSGNVQAQEFIQTNQMGQTLMVPLSPKQVSLSSGSNNRSNSTFVQQNTTIVQQQTTLVSNSHNTQMSSITTNLQGGNSSRLSIDPNVLLGHKQMSGQKQRNFIEMPQDNGQHEEMKDDKHQAVFNQMSESEVKVENSEGYPKFMNEFGPTVGSGQGQGGFGSYVRHSVSTQTLVNQQRGKSPSQASQTSQASQAVAAGSGCSPPDTTTLSPLGAPEPAASPRLHAQTRCLSTQANYADTTTKSPEPVDANSSAMVQCVSSSEQDMAESREQSWSVPRSDFSSDNETQSMMTSVPLMRQSRTHSSVESTDLHYSQNINTSSVNNQHNVLPAASSYYDRTQGYKRKNDFGDGSSYRTDKIMRTNYNMVHGIPKDSEYDTMGISSPEKIQARHFPQSGTSTDTSAIQKVFDRHSLGSSDDGKSEEEAGSVSDACGAGGAGGVSRRFSAGDVVWGPARGFASWPGVVQARGADGRLRVRWFGEPAAAALPPARLLTLSEGLEAHHAASSNLRKSRKLNALLENAIQEAMAELDKKSARGKVAATGEDEVTPVEEVADEVTEGTTSGTGNVAGGKSRSSRGRTRRHRKRTTNPSKTGEGARLRSSR
ncbi:LOW QUALITY PROTEIN: uncharacterized protein ACR2FA_011741 [Aphomia sociella]